MKKLLSLVSFVAFGSAMIHAQNNCGDALPITAGIYTLNAVDGTQIPLPVCSTGGEGATAGKWYKYTATENLLITVTTDFPDINGNIDNRVQVYDGSCTNLNCVAGDDDGGTSFLCVVEFNAIANTDYYIAFDNRWSSAGFTFELLENAPLPAPEVSFVTQNFTNIFGQYKNAIVDMNGDYLDDIVSVSTTSVNILFQQADGSFEESTVTTSPAQFLPNWSLAIGDINKDGFNDLLYGAGSGVSFFISNETGTEYTHFATSNYVFSQRSNFVDLNNDGHLDAFVCHDVAPNVYYINDGNGNLTFNQGGIGDHPTGGHYATIWTDFDNDGLVDVFISKCSGGGQGQSAKFNELHMNNGDGTFTNVSEAANMNHPNQTWSSAVNDFDNDGYMDVIVGVSSFSDGGHLFMHNNGDGTFTDITEDSGLDTLSSTAIEYVSYDFNNDGWADVFTHGRIWINNGNNTFTVQNVPCQVGPIGDLNNDGFLDIQNGNTIFFNQPNDNNWVKMNLKGVQSNRNGIGARVEIYGAWGKQIRDVQAGIGFRNMGTLNPHFGLGQAEIIDSVIVRWPSGIVDLICNPSINSTLFIEEGTGILPLAAFSVSENVITAGESVNFTDASTICAHSWEWAVTPEMGWNFNNGTTASSQHPQIQFNNTGAYTVSLTVFNANGASENYVSEEIIAQSGVGLESYAYENLQLFPNPANDLIHLQIDGFVEVINTKIISSVGAELLKFEGLPSQIDVKKLNSGVYFVAVQTSNGGLITRIFVKR